MRGSKKQLMWANDIQTATLDAIDYLIAEGQKYKGIPNADALLNKLASQRDAVANCAYAGDMIDCFEQVNLEHDSRGRAKAFLAACRIVKPNSPAQCRMLGKSIDKGDKSMTINIDKASLNKAAAATVDWPARTGHTEICFDRSSGEVFTIDHANDNDFIRPNDPSIITVCCTNRHMSADNIERRIIEVVRLIDAYT